MRVGWTARERGESKKPWVLERQGWKKEPEVLRDNHNNIRRWLSKESAERYARELNIQEALS